MVAEVLVKKSSFLINEEKLCVFSFFKDHCPFMNPHLTLQKHVGSIKPAVNVISSFQIPFGVSVVRKFKLRPLLNNIYAAFGLYSVMKN